MTISKTDIAGIVAYLVAAQAITATSAQDEVWHDYVTHEIPDVEPHELRPAARRCLHDWHAQDRAWRVDVARYAATIRRTRAERIRAEEDAHGRLAPIGLDREPALANRWIQAARRAIGAGHNRADADRLAWQTIGRQPPPPEISLDDLHGPEKARAVLAAIAARKGMPR